MNALSLKTGIQTFSPSYFALVMSTGVISIASNMLGYHTISTWLFIINHIEFLILSVLFILRLVFFFPAFRDDLSSHAEGAGFLTIIAASCILGTEYALLEYHFDRAIILWGFALCAWLILVYSFFILVTIKK
ncbi:MAG: C4-dicarboxylate ABC transporter, partial [Ginsengibacter sp.]